MYNINATGISSQSSQAVAEFEQAYFYPSDVPLFEKKFGLPIQPVAKIIGKNDPSSGYLGEASLDVEYIIGVGTQIPTWVFSFDLFDLVNWAINVSSTPNAPKVHSISWGSGESGYDPTEMRRVDTEFQKLGLLGMSVFAASGDQGTGHTGTFWCGSFDPTFPASAPHVTAVGGTYLDQSTQREIAVSFSGGGCVNIYCLPYARH
jgi:tripeptidyl-peptidase-1